MIAQTASTELGYAAEIELKLTSQSVGGGYFHFLFVVLYSVYIGFAAMHFHRNRFRLCIPCTAAPDPLRFHSKRMSVVVAFPLFIATAAVSGGFNLYLYESQRVEHRRLFCYFMSLALCFGRSVLAQWLFHCWIQFNFGTVHSR